MDGWLLWVIVACAFGVGEMLTGGGFWLAPFAIGALAAAIGAAALGTGAGLIVFLVASVLSLALIRPIITSRLRIPPTTRTGAAALVGKQATVVERIVNAEGVGLVRIDGDVWTARSLYDDEVIEAGTRVDVVDIKGATALVSE